MKNLSNFTCLMNRCFYFLWPIYYLLIVFLLVLSLKMFLFCHYVHKKKPFLRKRVLRACKFNIDCSCLRKSSSWTVVLVTKDCLCWASRFLILVTSSFKSLSASLFFLAPKFVRCIFVKIGFNGLSYFRVVLCISK